MAIIVRESFSPKNLMPQDTLLACPLCSAYQDPNGQPLVEAAAPREVWRFGARIQDRWCLVCHHRWTTVLPPAYEAKHRPATVSWFKVK